MTLLDKILTKILLYLIALYRVLATGKPSCCVHNPSCSIYAEEKLKELGAIAGLIPIISRIMSCHPWTEAN